MTEVISELMREHIQRLAASGTRTDGRAFDEPRKLVVEKNYIKTAEGSARVRLGNTDVLVGIKIDTGEPYPDTPNSGVLSTSAELIPMASPSFESGPPRPEAIELARVVDRGIRETKAVNMENMCIVPNEKVWVMFIDIHVLDYDGNLFDASSYGAVAALSCAKVPASKIGKEDYPLPLENWPVSVTSARIGDTIVVDPNLDEERIADARLTVTTDEKGDLRAMQKGLKGSFRLDEIRRIIETSQRVGRSIRETIRT
ncbi:MAG TPA: exosome complex protein Rrp42 [Thermoplasmata archaeon]|nr:exosome complex protein Rrp42 [Thermoplasmata archaeon]